MLTTFQKRIHEWLLENFSEKDFSALSYNAVTNWFNPNPLTRHEIKQLQTAKIQANAKLHNFI